MTDSEGWRPWRHISRDDAPRSMLCSMALIFPSVCDRKELTQQPNDTSIWSERRLMVDGMRYRSVGVAAAVLTWLIVRGLYVV